MRTDTEDKREYLRKIEAKATKTYKGKWMFNNKYQRNKFETLK